MFDNLFVGIPPIVIDEGYRIEFVKDHYNAYFLKVVNSEEKICNMFSLAILNTGNEETAKISFALIADMMATVKDMTLTPLESTDALISYQLVNPYAPHAPVTYSALLCGAGFNTHMFCLYHTGKVEIRLSGGGGSSLEKDIITGKEARWQFDAFVRSPEETDESFEERFVAFMQLTSLVAACNHLILFDRDCLGTEMWVTKCINAGEEKFTDLSNLELVG